ncbi:MAG: tyrosine-type recombinase/integrase [Lachnospiraceae bacterium]|nr:tyrosine-type recombinase/integrase [Lachnospiraceae bacterium]
MLEAIQGSYINTKENTNQNMAYQDAFFSGALECCHSQLLIKELAELWFLDIKKIMRPSSYAVYLSYANKYILPHIGNMQADTFNAEILSSLLGEFCTGINGEYEKLSQYTVYLLESMVRSMFHYGAEKKLIHEIPFGKAEFITVKKKEAVPLSELEIQQLLYIVGKQGKDLQLQVSVPLYTGVTLSELCGLKWEDINLETGEIHVHRNIVRIQHNMPSESKDMSETSTVLAECELPENMCRKFIMPEKLCTILKTEAYGRGVQAESYVAGIDKKAGRKKRIPVPEDAPDGRTLQYRLKVAGEKAGVKGLTFKTLRDTFAVLCLQAGGDVYSLAYVMGTGIPAVCDRYGQWMVKTDKFLKNIV